MSLLVKHLLERDKKEELELEVITKNISLKKEITTSDINRPGLSLVGFYDDFAYKRIQIFGRGEYGFLKKMERDEIRKKAEQFFSYDIPCCIFTYGKVPPKDFISVAIKHKIPILKTSLPTSKFIRKLTFYLNEELANSICLHGVLMEIFGVGVLIMGKSGVGKSECALELIEKGHLLITDDVVLVKNIADELLVGMPYGPLGYIIEIKGVGIINVKELFGVKAIKERKKIDIIIHLEEYPNEQPTRYNYAYKEFPNFQYKEILGIKLPLIIIPIKPGRSTATLVETAVINYRQRIMGENPIIELEKALKEWKIQQENNENS